MNKIQSIVLIFTMGISLLMGGVVAVQAGNAMQNAMQPVAFLPAISRPLPYYLNAFEAEVIQLVNNERVKNGCSALSPNPFLRQAAYLHSRDMGDNLFFDHTGSDGSNFVTRARRAGYGGSPRGENIAAGYGSPAAVMSGWMNSTGHRNNILSCTTTEIGVGYYQAGQGYGHYWTQVFGRD